MCKHGTSRTNYITTSRCQCSHLTIITSRIGCEGGDGFSIIIARELIKVQKSDALVFFATCALLMVEVIVSS